MFNIFIMIIFQQYTSIMFMIQQLCFLSSLIYTNDLILWTNLYTRDMYPLDCTMMTGILSQQYYYVYDYISNIILSWEQHLVIHIALGAYNQMV